MGSSHIKYRPLFCVIRSKPGTSRPSLLYDKSLPLSRTYTRGRRGLSIGGREIVFALDDNLIRSWFQLIGTPATRSIDRARARARLTATAFDQSTDNYNDRRPAPGLSMRVAAARTASDHAHQLRAPLHSLPRGDVMAPRVTGRSAPRLRSRAPFDSKN